MVPKVTLWSNTWIYDTLTLASALPSTYLKKKGVFLVLNVNFSMQNPTHPHCLLDRVEQHLLEDTNFVKTGGNTIKYKHLVIIEETYVFCQRIRGMAERLG